MQPRDHHSSSTKQKKALRKSKEEQAREWKNERQVVSTLHPQNKKTKQNPKTQIY